MRDRAQRPVKCEQCIYEAGSAGNGLIVIVLIGRLRQRQLVIQEERDAKLSEMVGAIKVLLFPSDFVAVNQQCDHSSADCAD